MKILRSTFRKKIGVKIKELRLKQGLTQQEVAADFLSLRAYQKIEQGASNARVDSLCIIAIRLGVKPFQLLQFSIHADVRQYFVRPKTS